MKKLSGVLSIIFVLMCFCSCSKTVWPPYIQEIEITDQKGTVEKKGQNYLTTITCSVQNNSGETRNNIILTGRALNENNAKLAEKDYIITKIENKEKIFVEIVVDSGKHYPEKYNIQFSEANKIKIIS